MACDWNINHRECTNTWGVLFTLEELKTKFDASGAKTMNQLAFWNPAASAAQRSLDAAALADRFDTLTTSPLLKATYETGFNKTKAKAALTDALVVAAKTVCELSQTVDEVYRFRSEAN